MLAIVIKAFFVQAFYIPSESMEPGLVNNDRILVQKVSYWGGGSPSAATSWSSRTRAAGCAAPRTAVRPTPSTKAMAKIGLYPSGGHLVKRVIGVAGDTIDCCDDQGRLSVNGDAARRGRLRQGRRQHQCNGPMIHSCDWTAGPVPEGHIFVMGDNRARSADSSVHMCRENETDCVPGDEFVPVDLVVGKVFVLLWPRDHFRWVHRPDAFADVPDPT